MSDLHVIVVICVRNSAKARAKRGDNMAGSCYRNECSSEVFLNSFVGLSKLNDW